MSAFGLILRATVRTRWRAWLGLAILVAITGGAVLAAVGAARRTASAVPRLLTATHSPDVFLVSGPMANGPVLPQARVQALPGVASDARGTGFLYGELSVGGTAATQANGGAGVFELPLGPGGLEPKVLTGRLPDPTNPLEALAGYNLRQSFPTLRVGSPVAVVLLAHDQTPGAVQGNSPPALGASVTLTVVGITMDGNAFPTSSQGSGEIIVTPAFVTAYAAQSFTGAVDAIRLRTGGAGVPAFQGALQSVTGVSSGLGDVGLSSLDARSAVAEASIHPQVVGWWILAAFASFGALAVIGQALGRQAAAEAGDLPALRALGLKPGTLLLLGEGRALLIGLAGGVGAVALAVATSPLTPVGLARVAEPAPGLRWDVAVVLGGLFVVPAATVLAGAWPAWRAARARVGSLGLADSTLGRPSAITTWLARAGASPSAVLGSRLALEPGSGQRSIPTKSSVAGAVAGVAALVGTVAFGASLSHLIATPRLYGNDFQLGSNGPVTPYLLPGSTDVEATDLTLLAGLPGISSITVGEAVAGSVGSRAVSVLGVASLSGPLALSIVSGRPPSGPNEVALGASTMRATHARIGSSIMMTIATSTATYRVVGEAALPLQFDGESGGLGNGAVVTLGALTGPVCSVCTPSDVLADGGSEDVYVSFSSQSALRAAQQETAAQDAVVARDPTTSSGSPLVNLSLVPDTSAAPAVFVSFGQSLNFPLLLSLIVAIFAAAALAHLLVVSVRRRRPDVGVLKAMGLLPRQVAAAICWQAATVMLVGIGIGAPLGIIAGRLAWHIFSNGFGVVNVTVIPWSQIVALAVACLVAAEAIAVVPALIAARVRPAAALREV